MNKCQICGHWFEDSNNDMARPTCDDCAEIEATS